MGEQFKLDSNGTCLSCNTVAATKENLQCYLCEGVFHGACSTMSEDDKVGSKSLIGLFNGSSTKKNLKFFCDICLTKFEIDLVNTDRRRLNTVEDNITSIKTELEEIKNLLKEKPKPTTNQGKNNSANSATGNIWFDKARLETTPVSPAEQMLVLDNTEIVSDLVEKAIVRNSIPVKKSFKNNSGKLCVVMDDQDARDKLRNVMATQVENIEMKSVTRKKPSVTIVGLSKLHTKEEVIQLIVSQNQYVKQFATVNNIDDHIEIHDIKATRSKPSVFQAFASVSEALRKGFRNFNDKVTIGLTSCKIYDRFHVKRCNNCQGLGHYYKECPTPDTPCCAKCGLDHATNTCSSTTSKCVNCTKAGKTATDHTAYDPKCPVLQIEVEKKKKSSDINLNSQRSRWAH